jgi:hypothetical protein
MAAGVDKKKLAELTALREKLNKAERRRDFAIVADACLAIIALDKREPTLNILAFLYHKDLGVAYLKLLEFEKALSSFKTAREGLIQYRATAKLKYPEDWLNELKVIDRLIHKTETVHLK